MTVIKIAVRWPNAKVLIYYLLSPHGYPESADDLSIKILSSITFGNEDAISVLLW